MPYLCILRKTEEEADDQRPEEVERVEIKRGYSVKVRVTEGEKGEITIKAEK